MEEVNAPLVRHTFKVIGVGGGECNSVSHTDIQENMLVPSVTHPCTNNGA